MVMIPKTMMPSRSFSTLLLLGLAGQLSFAADVTPAKPLVYPLFGDHMVLQRGKADPIWGWADPGQTVTITVKGKTVQAVAGADGRWETKIGPFKAGGPCTITIAGPKNTVVLSDILFGDVWVCSGQSNMEFGMGNLKDPQQEIQNANYPQIRIFEVPKVVNDLPQSMFGPVYN